MNSLEYILETAKHANYVISEILDILPNTDLVYEAKEIMKIQYYILSFTIEEMGLEEEDLIEFTSELNKILNQTKMLKKYG